MALTKPSPLMMSGPGAYRFNGSYPNSATNYWTNTATSYGDFTVVGTIPTITNIASNGITVANATSNMPGASFTAPKTGVIRVTMKASVIPGQVSGNTNWGLRIFETTTAAVLDETGGSTATNNTANAAWPVPLVGFLSVTSGAAYNVKLQSEIASGTFYLGANARGKALTIHLEYIT